MNRPTIAEIESIVRDDPRYYYRTIKRIYPKFFDEMNSGKLPIAESIYCWLYNDNTPVLCACGKKPGFEGIRLGYREFCSSKCAANADSVKQKHVITSLERFGVSNCSQSKEIRQKFYKTMQSRYGVLHALQNSELSAKSVASFKQNDAKQIVTKRQRTNVARYGTEHASQNPDIKAKRVETSIKRYGIDTKLRDRTVIDQTRRTKREAFMANITQRVDNADPLFDEFNGVNLLGERILYPWRCHQCQEIFDGHLDDGRQPRCPKCFPPSMSSGQAQIRDFLLSHDFNVASNNRRLIPPFELDIVLQDQQIAIEYNGLYYHHDERIDRNYHLNKTMRCQQIGFRLLHIYEGEWLHKRDIVQDRLLSILKCNNKIHARKTQITVLSFQQANEFLGAAHLQGNCPSSLRLGLMFEDKLVACMTFGKARFTKSFDFELLRYASALGVNVVGGAGKLFSHFRKLFPESSVISYSDRRWNTGQLYPKIGFTYSHSSTPNYFYSRDKVHLLSRHLFQKHKLKNKLPIFDPKLSEVANMYANGYIRTWDCGNDVFVFRPTV